MGLINCEKCQEELLIFFDSSSADEVKDFLIICPCGNKNNVSFIGFPKLAGTEKYYFEFTKDQEITCKKR